MESRAPTRAAPPHPSIGIVLDIVAVFAALALAVALRGAEALAPFWQQLSPVPRGGLGSWDRNEWALTVYQAFAIPTLLFALGQYRLMRDPQAHWSFNRVMLGVAATFGVLLAILFALRITAVPRTTLVLDFLALVVLAASWRHLWSRRVRRRHERGEALRNVLFLGASGLCTKVASHIVTNVHSGRRVAGFLTNEPVAPDAPPENGAFTAPEPLSVAGACGEMALKQPRHLWASIYIATQQDIPNALDGLGVEEVMIGPHVPRDVMKETVTQCQTRGIDVHLIPEHYEDLGIQPQPWTLGPFTLFDVHRRPISRLGWMAKRGMDIAGGLVGLVLFSPVIGLTALALKIENRGEPVFYPGKRVGLKGRTFRMAKFTTMRPDAQEIEKGMDKENLREGPWFKLEAENDPRLTRVGRFIRKYSINEIPQFWNILKGDMSLVGPRPPIPEEVASYVDYDFRYFRCLDVRPGLTGLWQVTAKNDPSFDRRIDLDMQYITGWSIWLDIKILFKTLWTVVSEPEE